MINVSFSLKMISKPLDSGKYPIVLLISWRGRKSESRRKRLGISCYPHEWEEVQQNKQLKEAFARAVAIYRSMEAWDYNQWCSLFDKPILRMTFDGYAKEMIQGLISADRGGTAIYYQDCLKALQKFLGREQIDFEAVTKFALKELEKDYISRGYKGDRLMRGLKAIYGKAVEDEAVDKNLMPFKCGYNPTGYKFADLKKIKKKDTGLIKRLSVSEVAKVLSYQPSAPSLKRSLDLWKFSYYTMGVNLKDISLMKMSDIKEGIWYYEREKTGEGGAGKLLIQEAMDIIHTYHNPHNKYIFQDILKDQYDKNDLAIRKRLRDVLSGLREDYKVVSSRLGLNGYFSFYSARYTSSTITANRGGDMKAIQMLMDHAHQNTTENYVKYSNLTKQRETLELLRV